MSGVDTGLRLSPHEALARDLISERATARHRARRVHEGRAGLRVWPTRVPRRAAVLLRTVADRLDRPLDGPGERATPPPVEAVARVHPAAPRPWAPAPRRSVHRHG